MEQLKLCFKNMWRNSWRTRIIILIVVFGTCLTFIFENLIEDISHAQSDMFSRSVLGHFRILNANINVKNSFGYYFYKPEEMLKPEEITELKKYLSGIKEVNGYEERIIFYGLLYGDEDTEEGFQGTAMDMDNFNRNFTDLYYAKGTPIKSGEESVCAASFYEYEWKDSKIVDVGKEYVFLIPNYHGEYVDRFITVKGGIDYRSMPKENMGFGSMFFDLDTFRNMTGYEEAMASELVGFLKDARQEAKILKKVGAFLKEKYPHLQVVSWRVYAPIFGEVVVGFDILMKVVEGILLIICILLVVKLTTFSIIERYKEIGTMRAIGFSQGNIIFQFTTEGFLTIAIGSIIGFLLGALIIYTLHNTGIRSDVSFLAYVIGRGFKPTFYPEKITFIVITFFIVSIAAPLLPSIRGGRLSILKTLEKR
ncbi:MAG: FtsX-like permease family protein [Spirochaetales bacterium]|nr:FtsX-like permease family protein [Spirochaetales bacterium]